MKINVVTDKVKQIYDGLNAGKRYILRRDLANKQALFDGGKLRFFVPTANLYMTNGYIGWQHYGSSANKNTLKELQWVIDVIFNGDDDFVDMADAEKDVRCGVDNAKRGASY